MDEANWESSHCPRGIRYKCLRSSVLGMQDTCSHWPGSKPDASFSLLLFLVAFSSRLLTGSGVSTAIGKKKRNTCPASSWTFPSDQLLEFVDLQPFPSRGEGYDEKCKTDRKKIPVLSSICASPRTSQSRGGSLAPVDQSTMASTLESLLLWQVSAKPS